MFKLQPVFPRSYNITDYKQAQMRLSKFSFGKI